MDLYLDCEWFLNQKVFLIGYAYNLTEHGQLYENTLNYQSVRELFLPIDGFVFFYGPDIAMIEKNFNMDIRNNFNCVNLIRIFKLYNPGMSSYKLASLEHYYGIERTTPEYKANIFKMLKDWYDPKFRKRALLYNQEDVINLIKVKRLFFKDENVRSNNLYQYLLR